MILNDFTEPKLKFSRDKLDAVLAEVCSLVIAGQRDNPDFNGWVGAAVIDPRGRVVTGVNYLYGNKRIHAERTAIDNYEQEYGELPKGCIVVTTLSPCSDPMVSRHEESCADLLNSKHVKIAYCGYQDPTQENIQDNFVTIITDNGKIESLCKKFADTFLKDDLNESQLYEYDRNKTESNYGAKIVSVARRDATIPQQLRKEGDDLQIIDAVLTQLEKADPTNNKEYTQGLAKLYANGGLKMEDATSTLADYLARFHKLKVKKMIPPPYNDFLRYNKVRDMMDVVDQLPDPDAQVKQDDKGDSSEYYNDDQIRVIVPETEAAACYYGRGTRWCTAGKNNNMFDHYAQEGTIYIVIPKHPLYPGEKYQFHFESNQFMDPQDDPVDLSELAERYPSLKDAFSDQAGRYDIIAFMSPEQMASLAVDGKKYIKFHAKDHGEGIITININANDPYNFNLVPSAGVQVGAAFGRDLRIPAADEETLYSGFVVADPKNNDVYVVYGTVNYDGDVDVSIGTTFATAPTKSPKNPRTEEIINWLVDDLKEFLNNQGSDQTEDEFNELVSKYGQGVE